MKIRGIKRRKGGGYQKMIWVSKKNEGVLGIKWKSKPCAGACWKGEKNQTHLNTNIKKD